MVLRLFVQPGEGKHWIVVKRPEPLPANATVSYVVATSTVLAAGYTSYATNFTKRVGPASGISAPALFIRASARAGPWCALTGAVINWYYHHAFATPICEASDVKGEKWKLWEKTQRYTVDDGFLAGAGLGLATGFLSAVFLRRMSIPWWSKILGMTNTGAFAGIAASNGYFQYTGERQKSALALEQWRKRRNLEFHWIYWNKLLLANLPVPVQAYVLWNGIFHTARLPEEALNKPEKFGLGVISDTSAPSREKKKDEGKEESQDTSSAPKVEPEEKRFYLPASDYLKQLEESSVEEMKEEVQDLDKKRKDLLKEAEYMAYEVTQKQYEVCHAKNVDEDERQRRLRELQLLKVVFNKLRAQADELDRRLFFGNSNLRQHAVWKTDNDIPSEWAPAKADPDVGNVKPEVAMRELKQISESIVKEIANFEQKLKNENPTAEQKAQLKRDLDDGRIFLSAADRLNHELEKKNKKVEEELVEVETKEEPTLPSIVGPQRSEKRDDVVKMETNPPSPDDAEPEQKKKMAEQKALKVQPKRQKSDLEPDKP